VVSWQNEECQSLGSVVKEENMSFAVVYEMADMENSARVFPCNRWERKSSYKVVFVFRTCRKKSPFCPSPFDSPVPEVFIVFLRHFLG
jgi:hypothetical protein